MLAVDLILMDEIFLVVLVACFRVEKDVVDHLVVFLLVEVSQVRVSDNFGKTNMHKFIEEVIDNCS